MGRTAIRTTTSPTATAAAFLAGALEDAIVIAPRVASADGSCRDVLAENEVSWSCGGDSWRSGGVAASHKDLTSFDFMDAILKKLANKQPLPESPRRSWSPAIPPEASSSPATRWRTRSTTRSALPCPTSSPIPPVMPGLMRRVRCRWMMPRRRTRRWAGRKRSRTPISRTGRSMPQPARVSTSGRPDSRIAPPATRKAFRDEQLKKQLVSRPDDVPAVAGGHAAARRVRFVLPGDGARRDAPRARRGLRQVRERDAGREARASRSCPMRPQRSLRLHDDRSAAGHLPEEVRTIAAATLAALALSLPAGAQDRRWEVEFLGGAVVSAPASAGSVSLPAPACPGDVQSDLSGARGPFMAVRGRRQPVE